jgi:extradiol dioxygenase family protein
MADASAIRQIKKIMFYVAVLRICLRQVNRKPPMPTPFHLANQLRDLAKTRACYATVLGCVEGRSTQTWIDFNFFGHQRSMFPGASPSMFFRDPSGNPIDIMGFANLGSVLSQ